MTPRQPTVSRRRLGRTVGTIAIRGSVIGSALSPKGTAMQIVWTIPTGLTWLFILGCAVAAWIAGYGTGYRKGARDAIKDKVLKAAPALDGE
jgi:hypothetical protein